MVKPTSNSKSQQHRILQNPEFLFLIKKLKTKNLWLSGFLGNP